MTVVARDDPRSRERTNLRNDMRLTSTDAVQWVQDPGRLRAMHDAIRAGSITPVELVERFAKRIAEADAAIQAWVLLDFERAHTLAQQRTIEAREGRLRGALHGIPVAIKDVADVAGMPTRANSRSRDSIAPAAGDAEIVRALKAAGAIVIGKTHTTEYAYFDPSPARNPHHPGHTPGGSSSGSAAAVAAGMVPLALGTQTVASVNRPAAYCGIAAFKPSTGSLSGFGLTPLGPSYDTPGVFGWSVDDAVWAYEAIAPAFIPGGGEGAQAPRLGVPLDAHLNDAEPDMLAAFEQTLGTLEAGGYHIERFASPIDFKRLFEIQRSTMLFEAGRALGFLREAPAGAVGAKLLEAIGLGQALPESQYLDERAEIRAMREQLLLATSAIDVFVWPATPGPAPQGLAWTGDPRFIAPWTALGGPIVSMPVGLGGAGLPLGVSLCGKPGSDRLLAGWARGIARLAERHR